MYPTGTRFSSFPPLIKNLLILNGMGFIGQLVVSLAQPGLLEYYLGLHPLASDFQYWQLVTYAFLHGGIMHLFFNMFALWMFGMQIENTWGTRRFAIFYFSCVVGAALVQLVFQAVNPTSFAITIGASRRGIWCLGSFRFVVSQSANLFTFSAYSNQGQVASHRIRSDRAVFCFSRRAGRYCHFCSFRWFGDRNSPDALLARQFAYQA